MATHPYKTLPAHCFWRDAAAGRPPEAVDPVVRAKFKIDPRDKVATAGSDFAQHIARRLESSGYHHLVTETAPPHAAEAEAARLGYGVYTARYGDIHTSRQFLQLLLRAYGALVPDELAWSDETDRFIDPFRPHVQPGGFDNFEELEADRAHHFACVRRAVETMHILIVTLSQTETWVSRDDGAAFPICPGVAGGEFDEAHYLFANLTVADVVADLETAIWFIRTKNRDAKLILTVSPIPPDATAINRSVLVSTAYSKSVLRVAAEQVSEAYPHVAYFPAYEILTGPQARGRYYDEDFRDLTAEGVEHVTQLFMHHYADGASDTRSASLARVFGNT
jgi:GSCFA family